MCSNSFTTPFTGYRLEYQIPINSWEGVFHLVCCHDNKLIYDLPLNSTIPWTRELDFRKLKNGNRNKLTLARKRALMMKNLPLYLPDQTIGGLFIDGSNTSIPLVSDNILTNWLEMTFRLGFILHVPILSTPNIDDKRYTVGQDRDNSVSITETYEYKTTKLTQLKNSFMGMFNNITEPYVSRLSDSTVFKSMKRGSTLTKFILLSKLLSEQEFQSLLKKYHSMTTIKD